MEDVPNIPTQKVKPEETKINTPVQAPPDLSSVVNTNVNTEQPKSTSVISYEKKKSFIDYFIYIVAAVAFLVWMAVAAIYLQNRGSKETPVETNEVAEATPTLIPVKRYNVTTKNGDVININDQGEEEVLVKKADYPLTGISGFLKVSVSPDQKKLCFESWPPSPEPGLYISDIDGTNVVKVNADRKNCIWSSDASLLAYNDVKSEKEGSDLFLYDALSAAETLLTIHTATETAKPKLHTATGWGADNKKITCEYSYLSTIKDINDCEVDIESRFVNYF